VAAYADIAKSTSDPLFRDLAIVRSSLLTAETAKFEETKAQLEPIAKGTGPWRVLALEMLAYASWRAGKKDEALKMYAEVQTSPGAPDGTKRRALEMVAMISGGMTVADIDKMLAEAAATPARSLLPDMPSAAGGLLGPAEAPVLPDPTKPATP
jgi:hypothetical protein